ncbi:MAG: hypothetical protein WD035_03780 [Balneolaceae bacterium]
MKQLKKYLNKYPNISEWPITLSTVEHAFEIDDVPELHDRLVAAAAKELIIPILTNDLEIHRSQHVTCIWEN